MTLAVAMRCARAPERALPAEPALDVLRVLAHHQPMPDELAWRAVLHALDGKDGVLADPRRHLVVLGRAPRRQRPQHRAFDGLALGRAGIEALHDLLDERLVARAVVEAT
jgi:hypothetical protein